VSGELLLVDVDEFVQSRDVIEKDPFPRSLDGRENPVVILGVLSHPRIAIVDVIRLTIVIETIRHADEPLGKIIGLESIVGTRVSEIDDQFERLGLKEFESEENVRDQQITIHFVHFESTRDVTEDRRVVLFTEPGLIEDVQCCERLKFFAFVHLRLGHQFFELRRRHVARDPLRFQRSMIGRTEIGQQRAHLVEGMSTDGVVIASTGEIVADLLLMIPEKSMQRENVGVADGRHRIGRIDAGDCFPRVVVRRWESKR
jgi:hypothetical protein